MISPPFEMAFSGASGSDVSVPPSLSTSSFMEFWKCFTCFISWSDHDQENFRTGMPNLSFVVPSISQKDLPFGIISPRWVKLMRAP